MVDPIVQRVEQALRNPLLILGGGAVVVVLTAAAAWLVFPLIQPLLVSQFWFSVLVLAVSLGLILTGCAVCILAERKIAGFIQDRKGPNRVGFWGLLQPMADGLKFFLKEDITPANVDRPLFLLAPALALMVSLLGFAIIPWAGHVTWPWLVDGKPVTVSTQVANLDVGFLYLIAVASLGVYGVVLAGYASNNKYSFYGGMRATAQMLSYEVPLGLGLLCVLLVGGHLRLDVIVQQQADSGVWNVLLHPLAFLLVLISGFAETNRTPFDLAEAEQELVGGYHTEYSSMKFALFFLAEYAHMITNSALMVALFFGGWAPLPFAKWLAHDTSWTAVLLKFAIYWGKISVLIGFYMLIRWTIPRFRYDQLMRLAWKALVPVGIVLVLATALLVVYGLEQRLWASLGMNIVVLAGWLAIAARSRNPITGRQENLPDVEVRPALP